MTPLSGRDRCTGKQTGSHEMSQEVPIKMAENVLSVNVFPERNALICICPSKYEPQREKTYLLTCAPSEDSNQLVGSCSLIRVFVVRMKKFCIHDYRKCAKWRFWSESLLDAQVCRYVFLTYRQIEIMIKSAGRSGFPQFRRLWHEDSFPVWLTIRLKWLIINLP